MMARIAGSRGQGARARLAAIALVAALASFGIAGWGPTAALGDGGAVCLRAHSGPFLITVFAAPFPLSAGAADLSVMVQRQAGNAPVLDARVTLKLTPPGGAAGAVVIHPTRAQATNKLLYAASVKLTAAGDWRITVHVRKGMRQAMVSGTLPVAASGSLGAVWKYLAVVPVVLLLFTLHQLLARRPRVEAG